MSHLLSIPLPEGMRLLALRSLHFSGHTYSVRSSACLLFTFVGMLVAVFIASVAQGKAKRPPDLDAITPRAAPLAGEPVGPLSPPQISESPANSTCSPVCGEGSFCVQGRCQSECEVPCAQGLICTRGGHCRSPIDLEEQRQAKQKLKTRLAYREVPRLVLGALVGLHSNGRTGSNAWYVGGFDIAYRQNYFESEGLMLRVGVSLGPVFASAWDETSRRGMPDIFAKRAEPIGRGAPLGRGRAASGLATIMSDIYVELSQFTHVGRTYLGPSLWYMHGAYSNQEPRVGNLVFRFQPFDAAGVGFNVGMLCGPREQIDISFIRLQVGSIFDHQETVFRASVGLGYHFTLGGP